MQSASDELQSTTRHMRMMGSKRSLSSGVGFAMQEPENSAGKALYQALYPRMFAACARQAASAHQRGGAVAHAVQHRVHAILSCPAAVRQQLVAGSDRCGAGLLRAAPLRARPRKLLEVYNASAASRLT
jgi:hypothetical protein